MTDGEARATNWQRGDWMRGCGDGRERWQGGGERQRKFVKRGTWMGQEWREMIGGGYLSPRLHFSIQKNELLFVYHLSSNTNLLSWLLKLLRQNKSSVHLDCTYFSQNCSEQERNATKLKVSSFTTVFWSLKKRYVVLCYPYGALNWFFLSYTHSAVSTKRWSSDIYTAHTHTNTHPHLVNAKKKKHKHIFYAISHLWTWV